MAKASKFHVHCKLPNASNLINGVEFAEHEEGGVRTVAPVDAEIAENFKSIPGYILLSAKGDVVSDNTTADPKASDTNPVGNTAGDGQTSFLPQ